MRSWLFAARLGQLKNTEHDAEVLAVATLLHDITLNKAFAGPRRFEVEGADLARSFATDVGVDRLFYAPVLDLDTMLPRFTAYLEPSTTNPAAWISSPGLIGPSDQSR